MLFGLRLDDCPPIHWAAEKCGIQPLAVAGAGLLWLLLFVLWGFMGELVCKVVGNLYPMYASFRALEDGDHEEAGQRIGVNNRLCYYKYKLKQTTDYVSYG